MIEYYNNIALVKNDSHISKWVKEHNSLIHNKSLYERLKPIIKKNTNVLEIGACIGDNTAFIIELTNQPVHSFEPNDKSFQCLKHNMYDKNVVCRQIALSDKVHGYDVFEPNENIGMAQILESESSNTTSTIDIYCQDIGWIPDFIICDAEGYEYKILRGGESIIKEHKPVLVLEVNEGALINAGTSRKELFDYLDDLGYKYADIYGEPLENLHTQFDIICYGKSN